MNRVATNIVAATVLAFSLWSGAALAQQIEVLWLGQATTRITTVAGKVIPIHYGTVPPLRGTPAQFRAALGESPIEVLDVQPGQAVKF